MNIAQQDSSPLCLVFPFDGILAARFNFIRTYDFSNVQRDIEREYRWDLGKVQTVTEQARAFYSCFLLSAPDEFLSPSPEVDKFWHAFILRTREYRAFCDQAFGWFLDHFPEDDKTKLQIGLDSSKRLHQLLFGQDMHLSAFSASCIAPGCGGGGDCYGGTCAASLNMTQLQ